MRGIELMDQDAQSAASDRPNPPTHLSKLVFFLPLVGYWLLAVLAAFHPRPLWVVEMVEPLLVLMALAVVGKVPGCSIVWHRPAAPKSLGAPSRGVPLTGGHWRTRRAPVALEQAPDPVLRLD
jgi:hypothetical protein